LFKADEVLTLERIRIIEMCRISEQFFFLDTDLSNGNGSKQKEKTEKSGNEAGLGAAELSRVITI
jgi:hypothetical protein